MSPVTQNLFFSLTITDFNIYKQNRLRFFVPTRYLGYEKTHRDVSEFVSHVLFMSLSVSHYFKNPQMSLGKLQILPKIENSAKNRKFCQNHQKSTNVGFCDSSFNKSLVLILRYFFFKVYDCRSLFDEKMTIFWIRKKKIDFFFPLQKKSKQSYEQKKVNNLTKKKKVNDFKKKKKPAF